VTPVSSTEGYAEARRAAREHGDFAPLVALVPYARFLGICVQAHGSGLRARLPFRDSLVGNSAIRALHGGVTAAFMENAALLHLLLRLDESRMPRSIDFSIDYLAPGQAEDTHAECSVTRLGLRVAQVQVRCWQSDERRPIAVARAHFLLTQPQ
jgi:uncharacterized protein (TIGR00369 family)